ncbi:MAG: glycosyltransferase family 2 protein, partial [Candidatus Omnitrophica bacterium]|nr:glycosyltransferase family 2 protein [Candidatus Omnitrophota bacterium]
MNKRKKTHPFVSIIIVNLNGEKYLKDCLGSLLNMKYPSDKFEIILVDNGSTDDSLEYTRKEFSVVKIIKNNENNYAKANNLGIKQSKGEYVALLNNDTKVEENWLIELLKVIESDNKIGAVGTKLLLPDGKIQNAGHIALPNFYWGERGFGEENLKYNEIEEMDSLCGAAVLYRKKLFREIGHFDENFVIYMEDVDMAFRLRKNGWKVVFVPTSIVYHFFHGSGNNDLSRFYIERNRLLFIAKHYPDKLESALMGNGYFSAQNKLDYLGKIYDILPDVIIKLQENHDVKIVKSALDGLMRELMKITNCENNALVKEILALKDNYEQKSRYLQKREIESSSIQKELSQAQTELTQAKDLLAKKETELSESRSTLG